MLLIVFGAAIAWYSAEYDDFEIPPLSSKDCPIIAPFPFKNDGTAQCGPESHHLCPPSKNVCCAAQNKTGCIIVSDNRTNQNTFQGHDKNLWNSCPEEAPFALIDPRYGSSNGRNYVCAPYRQDLSAFTNQDNYAHRPYTMYNNDNLDGTLHAQMAFMMYKPLLGHALSNRAKPVPKPNSNGLPDWGQATPSNNDFGIETDFAYFLNLGQMLAFAQSPRNDNNYKLAFNVRTYKQKLYRSYVNYAEGAPDFTKNQLALAAGTMWPTLHLKTSGASLWDNEIAKKFNLHWKQDTASPQCNIDVMAYIFNGQLQEKTQDFIDTQLTKICSDSTVWMNDFMWLTADDNEPVDMGFQFAHSKLLNISQMVTVNGANKTTWDATSLHLEPFSGRSLQMSAKHAIYCPGSNCSAFRQGTICANALGAENGPWCCDKKTWTTNMTACGPTDKFSTYTMSSPYEAYTDTRHPSALMQTLHTTDGKFKDFCNYHVLPSAQDMHEIALNTSADLYPYLFQDQTRSFTYGITLQYFATDKTANNNGLLTNVNIEGASNCETTQPSWNDCAYTIKYKTSVGKFLNARLYYAKYDLSDDSVSVYSAYNDTNYMHNNFKGPPCQNETSLGNVRVCDAYTIPHDLNAADFANTRNLLAIGRYVYSKAYTEALSNPPMIQAIKFRAVGLNDKEISYKGMRIQTNNSLFQINDTVDTTYWDFAIIIDTAPIPTSIRHVPILSAVWWPTSKNQQVWAKYGIFHGKELPNKACQLSANSPPLKNVFNASKAQPCDHDVPLPAWLDTMRPANNKDSAYPPPPKESNCTARAANMYSECKKCTTGKLAAVTSDMQECCVSKIVGGGFGDVFLHGMSDDVCPNPDVYSSNLNEYANSLVRKYFNSPDATSKFEGAAPVPANSGYLPLRYPANSESKRLKCSNVHWGYPITNKTSPSAQPSDSGVKSIWEYVQIPSGIAIAGIFMDEARIANNYSTLNNKQNDDDDDDNDQKPAPFRTPCCGFGDIEPYENNGFFSGYSDYDENYHTGLRQLLQQQLSCFSASPEADYGAVKNIKSKPYKAEGLKRDAFVVPCSQNGMGSDFMASSSDQCTVVTKPLCVYMSLGASVPQLVCDPTDPAKSDDWSPLDATKSYVMPNFMNPCIKAAQLNPLDTVCPVRHNERRLNYVSTCETNNCLESQDGAICSAGVKGAVDENTGVPVSYCCKYPHWVRDLEYCKTGTSGSPVSEADETFNLGFNPTLPDPYKDNMAYADKCYGYECSTYGQKCVGVPGAEGGPWCCNGTNWVKDTEVCKPNYEENSWFSIPNDLNFNNHLMRNWNGGSYYYNQFDFGPWRVRNIHPCNLAFERWRKGMGKGNDTFVPFSEQAFVNGPLSYDQGEPNMPITMVRHMQSLQVGASGGATASDWDATWQMTFGPWCTAAMTSLTLGDQGAFGFRVAGVGFNNPEGFSQYSFTVGSTSKGKPKCVGTENTDKCQFGVPRTVNCWTGGDNDCEPIQIPWSTKGPNCDPDCGSSGHGKCEYPSEGSEHVDCYAVSDNMVSPQDGDLEKKMLNIRVPNIPQMWCLRDGVHNYDCMPYLFCKTIINTNVGLTDECNGYNDDSKISMQFMLQNNGCCASTPPPPLTENMTVQSPTPTISPTPAPQRTVPPAPSPRQTNASSSTESKYRIPAIAMGAVVGMILCLLFAYLCLRRRRRHMYHPTGIIPHTPTSVLQSQVELNSKPKLVF